MYIKKLKSENSLNIEDYNRKKMRAENAEIVYKSEPGALKKINRLENSPKLDSRAKNLGIHIAISPALEEQVDIVKLVKNLLRKLGLLNQPWVLVRHHDIRRIHYHLISTRALKNGHTFSKSYLGKRIYKASKELCEEMGLKFNEQSWTPVDSIDLKHFVKEKGYITRQFTKLAEKVLAKKPESVQQFISMMRDMGVEVFLSTKAMSQKLIFAGLDEFGKRNTTPVYDLDKRWMTLAQLRKQVAENKKQSEQTKRIDTSFPTRSAANNVSAALSHEPQIQPTEPEVQNVSEENNECEKLPNYVSDEALKFLNQESRVKNQEKKEKKITPQSVAKKIIENLEDAFTSQEFFEFCEEEGIVIAPEFDIVNGYRLNISYLNFKTGERTDFDEEEIQSFLTDGEIQLIVKDSNWTIKERLLSQEYEDINNKIKR